MPAPASTPGYEALLCHECGWHASAARAIVCGDALRCPECGHYADAALTPSGDFVLPRCLILKMNLPETLACPN